MSEVLPTLEEILDNNTSIFLKSFEKVMSVPDQIFETDNEGKLSSNLIPFTLSLKTTDFSTEKELVQFVKSVERTIRSSPEYRNWISFVRDSLNLNFCQITGEKLEETTIELHHHPYTLFLVTKCVILDHIKNSNSFTSFQVAEEVVGLHYSLKVPFVMLVTTLHEKFHNGFLKIPFELVMGDKYYIYDKYSNLMTDEEKDLIIKYMSINRENCGWTEGYKWVVQNENY